MSARGVGLAGHREPHRLGGPKIALGPLVNDMFVFSIEGVRL